MSKRNRRGREEILAKRERDRAVSAEIRERDPIAVSILGDQHSLDTFPTDARVIVALMLDADDRLRPSDWHFEDSLSDHDSTIWAYQPEGTINAYLTLSHSEPLEPWESPTIEVTLELLNADTDEYEAQEPITFGELWDRLDEFGLLAPKN